jgi:hypothetical protein
MKFLRFSIRSLVALHPTPGKATLKFISFMRIALVLGGAGLKTVACL